jgi:hypothetical protein
MAWLARFAFCATILLGLLAATSAPALDLTTEPAGVLTPKLQQKLWDAYKTAKACFLHPIYGTNPPQKVSVLKPKAFEETTWTSPFTAVRGAPECEIGAPVNLKVPRPISKVTLDEAYGERQEDVDAAAIWFRHMTTYHRLSNDPVAADLLKQGLLAWAKGKGLAKGIHVSWGAKPVDYQMMATIMAFVAAAAEIAPDLTAEDRETIGPWLNDLVKQAAASVWKDRTDNKNYFHTYIALVWGLMVGDEKPVQDAVYAYKLAIHDMRPDGSWPVDSQRGAMGLHYNSAATSRLVMIALLLKQTRDVDLFSYEVDGRSVHTAVDFSIKAMQHPAETNAIYAIPCEEGGDRFGSISEPSMAYVEEMGHMVAYAQRFPDRESSKYILSYFAGRPSIDEEKVGGAAACLLATTGRDVTLPALVPLPPLPTPTISLSAHEELANKTGDDPQVNSMILADILDSKGRAEMRMTFNVQGKYDPAKGEMRELAFMIAQPLVGKPDPLNACGAKVEKWDNGEMHLRIDFFRAGTKFTIFNGDCIIKALTGNQARQVEILLHSFRDIAITMVNSGSVDVVRHKGLRDMLINVADGTWSVAG